MHDITALLVMARRQPNHNTCCDFEPALLYAPGEQTMKLTIVVYLLLTILLSVPFLRWQQRPALATGA